MWWCGWCGVIGDDGDVVLTVHVVVIIEHPLVGPNRHSQGQTMTAAVGNWSEVTLGKDNDRGWN